MAQRGGYRVGSGRKKSLPAGCRIHSQTMGGNAMTDNPTGWGGNRPGSGRKKMPAEMKKKNVAYRLSVEEKAAVDSLLKAMRSAKKKAKELAK